MREHNKHTCGYCGMSTAYAKNLRRHVLSVHNTQSVRCYACEKIFKASTMANHHLGKKHRHNVKAYVSPCIPEFSELPEDYNVKKLLGE